MSGTIVAPIAPSVAVEPKMPRRVIVERRAPIVFLIFCALMVDTGGGESRERAAHEGHLDPRNREHGPMTDPDKLTMTMVVKETINQPKPIDGYPSKRSKRRATRALMAASKGKK